MIIKPTITEMDVQALRAMRDGVANEGQQKHALEWIMREAARVTDLAYIDSGVVEDTIFASGRQYVGHLIRQMMLPATLIIARQNDKRRKAGQLPARSNERQRDNEIVD